MSHQGRLIRWSLIGTLVVSLAYPLSWAIRASVQVSRNDPSWTLEWYQRVVSSVGLQAIGGSAVIIGVAGGSALVLGFLLAWVVARVAVPFTVVARLVPVIPLLIPPVIGAAAWSFLLSPNAGYLNVWIRGLLRLEGPGPLNIYGFVGILFVITIYVVPFTYVIFYPALQSMNRSVEEAAYISGANWFTTARTVTLGIMRPAVLGAVIMAFVLSAAHFAIPFMLSRGRLNIITTDIYLLTVNFPSNLSAATAMSMAVTVPSLLLVVLNFRLLATRGYAVIGGKSESPARIRRPLVRWGGSALLLGYLVVASVLPIMGLVFVSLSGFWNGRLEAANFTLRHVSYVLTGFPPAISAIRTSVVLATFGASVSLVLGCFVAYISVRQRSRGARALDFISMVPLGLPAVVVGIAFLVAFSGPPIVLYGTIWLLLLAYVVMFLPHAVRPVSVAFRQSSVELEDAARMSGAGWFRSFISIALPLARPAIISAWIVLFVILSREVAASVFLVVPGMQVVGTVVFDLWNVGATGPLAAFCLVIVAASGLIIALAYALPAGAERILRLRVVPTRRRSAGQDVS